MAALTENQIRNLAEPLAKPELIKEIKRLAQGPEYERWLKEFRKRGKK